MIILLFIIKFPLDICLYILFGKFSPIYLSIIIIYNFISCLTCVVKSFILVLVSVKLFGRFSLVKSIGILNIIIKSNHLIINLNYIVRKKNKK